VSHLKSAFLRNTNCENRFQQRRTQHIIHTFHVTFDAQVDKPSAGSTKRSSNSFIAVFDSLRPDEGVGERVAEKIVFLRRSLNFLAQENDERTVWNLDQGPFTESTLPVFLPTWGKS